MSTQNINISGGEKIKEYLKKIKNLNSKLNVGFLDPEIAKIAIINEFGANIPVTSKMRAFFRYKFKINLKKETTQINIPARPFFQNAINNEENTWVELLAKSLVKFDYDLNKAFNFLGAKVAKDISESINKYQYIDNAPLTIKLKGFNRPLIDKGTMQRSVDYEVVS